MLKRVPDERAARVHVIMSVFAGTKQLVIRPRSMARPSSPSFPEKRGIHRLGSRARHHRVFDARAVLSVVNTLRYASTRREGRAFGH